MIKINLKNKNRLGLTLVELILALFVSGLVMIVGYSLLFTGEKQFDIGQKRVIIDSELNQIAFEIAEELKNSTIISSSYGENHIKIDENNLIISRNNSEEKMNESISIKSMNIKISKTKAGEVINYTIVANYDGLDSSLSSSVLLNNIDDSRFAEQEGITADETSTDDQKIYSLKENTLYYSKNYDVPKTYFMSGAKTQETTAYKAGILAAQVAIYYDGYQDTPYKGSTSHTTFASFERDIDDIFSQGTDKDSRKQELKNYITDPNSLDYSNFSKGYVYFMSTYDSYQYYKFGREDQEKGLNYEPRYDNSALKE